MSKLIDSRFVVYIHMHPKTKKVFYVGLGTEMRPTQQTSRSPAWKQCVSKHGFISNVIERNLSWFDACILEKKLIKKYGRKDLKKGLLVNSTNGGEGINRTSDKYKNKVINLNDKPLYVKKHIKIFLKSYAKKNGKKLKQITDEVLSAGIKSLKLTR